MEKTESPIVAKFFRDVILNFLSTEPHGFDDRSCLGVELELGRDAGASCTAAAL